MGHLCDTACLVRDKKGIMNVDGTISSILFLMYSFFAQAANSSV